MAWKYNPFTDSLDQTGSGGGSYIDGEVEYHSNLPVAGTPAVNSAFLVRKGEGLYFLTRKPAGIWVRELNNGNLNDWKYAGTFSDLYRDANFRILNNTDVTKELAFDVSGVATGATRTLTVPNESGSIQLALVVTSQFISANTALSAGRNRRITLSAVNQTVNVDLPYSGNADGDVVTLVASSGLFTGSTLSLRTASGMSGGAPSTYAALATLTAPDQSFTFVSDGTATGWRLRPVDTHTHAASQITGTFTTLAANNGTLTASAPVLDLSQTWNNAAVAFTALNINVTNTASSGSSFLINATSSSGTEHFRVDRGGQLIITRSSSTADAINVSGRIGTSNGIVSAVFHTVMDSQGFNMANTRAVIWSSTGSYGGTGDLFLRRDAAGVLAQYNGSNGQAYRLYNTYTDASNHERLSLRWASNVAIIGTEALGTGSARALELQTGGTTRFTIATNGAITCSSSLSVVSNLTFQGNSSIVGNIAAGVLRLIDNVGTSFNRLQFGGGTSSFPALKRDSTALQVRLADDSAYSVIDAQHRLQGTAPATSGAAGTAGDIRYDADYIYVCTAASTWKRAAIATW